MMSNQMNRDNELASNLLLTLLSRRGTAAPIGDMPRAAAQDERQRVEMIGYCLSSASTLAALRSSRRNSGPYLR